MDDEQRLVERAKTHKQAFLELYDHYYPKLYAYILSRSRNREITEDVVQQTFVKALEGIGQFVWKRNNAFGGWVFQIARTTLVDRYRKENRETPAETATLESKMDAQESVLTDLLEKEDSEMRAKLHRDVLDAMKTLSDEEQELISLKYFGKLSYAEIAQTMGKRENTLAVAVHRSIKKLRGRLDYDV